MLPNLFLRAVARVALMSYVTQLFAPVVYACDHEHPLIGTGAGVHNTFNSSSSHKEVIQGPLEENLNVRASYIPTSLDNAKTQRILEGSQPSTINRYQYKIDIKALDLLTGKFQFKVSRKAKTMAGPYEKLHTATIFQDKITPFFTEQKDTEEDTLLSLCKGSSLVSYKDDSMVWHIPGFATINVIKDGTVFLDQGLKSPVLSAYNLVLKTSGELFIQTLNIAALTLKSQKTYFSHAVVAERMHIDHEAVNEGGLQVKELTGKGKLTNHNYFKLVGTEDKPATLSIHQVINEKSKSDPKEAKIEGTYLRITPENHLFHNEEGTEVNIAEVLVVDPTHKDALLPSTPALVNKGSFHANVVTLNRRASNSGFLQSRKMTVAENPFINTDFGTLKILDELIMKSNLINEGDIDSKYLNLRTVFNKGKIKGDGLRLNVQEEMLNEGVVFLQHLSGDGVFKNHHTLKFIGDKGSATAYIRTLLNQTKSKDFRAQITGVSVTLNGENRSFINDINSDVVMEILSFLGNKTTPLSQIVRNLGTLKSRSIDLRYRLLENEGGLELTSLAVENGKLHNLAKGLVEVSTNLSVLSAYIQNDGHLRTGKDKDNKGSFSQDTGEFVNKGKWEHIGDLSLGSTKVSNHSTIIWQNGNLKLVTAQYHNQGNWLLEGIVCTQPLDIYNQQFLKLQNSCLTFSHLTNGKNLIFSSGQYTFTGVLKNDHLVSFQDNDWIFTDDGASTVVNRVVLKSTGVKNYTSLGEIESQKNLTYDVQTLPTALRAQQDIFFTPRHRASRTLADLAKVTTNKQGKVVFYTPAITTTQGYDFANIGHLALYVGGLFTTIHKLTAPTLTLDVSGPMTCGSSNTVIGGIAATEGPLTMTAHSIDSRFGKMYGKGSTYLKTTQGNILIGAPKIGVDADFKKYFYANTSFSTEELDPFDAEIMKQQRETELDKIIGCNEAYFASDDPVTIESAKDIIVDCGTVFSSKKCSFTAAGAIKSTASKIFSLGPTIIKGSEYTHTPKSPIGHYFEEAAFPGEGRDFPASGPSILDSVGDIHINTHSVTNRGSIVRTQGIIYVNGIAKNTNSSLPNYIEEPANYVFKYFNGTQWMTQVWFSYPCIVQSGKAIHLNTGNFIISGNMHSKTITIQATGTGLFDRSGSTSHTIIITNPIHVNLTSAIQEQARNNSLLRLTSEGEVRTEVPLGSPYNSLIGKNAIMLITGDNQHLYQIPLDSNRIFNPLQSLPLGLYNLFTQATLSQVAGRVNINDAQSPTLFQSLVNNGTRFGQEESKSLVTLEDVKRARYSMILPGLSQVGGKIHQVLNLIVAKENVNTVQGVSADTIDVHTQGGLTIRDMTIKAKKWLNFFSEEHLAFLSTITTRLQWMGTQDYLDSPTNVECEEGEIIALGKKGFQMTGAKLRSLLRLIAGSIEGNSDVQSVQLKRTEYSTHEKKGGFFKGNTTTFNTHTSTTSHPSELVSEKEEVSLLCGNDSKTTITGSLLKSMVAILFQGKNLETHADIAIHTTKTDSYTKGLFSSTQSHSVTQSATPYPTILNAPAIYTNTESAVYRGTDFIADIIYDNTKEGATFGPSTSWLEFFHQMITRSPFLKSDVGCKGEYEVMQPCRLAVNKLIRQVDEGEIKLVSVDWNKDRTQVIGKLAETTYQLNSWQTNWAHHKQLIPNEALVVVALGVTLATQGWGASLINSLAESLFGMVPVASAAGATMVPAVTLSATGMAMANAGFSAICSQTAASLMRTGDPIQVGQDLTSPGNIRSLTVTMLSAGLCQNIGNILKIGMHPGLAALTDPQKQVQFTDFLQANALKTVIETPLQILIGGVSVEDALEGNLKSLGVDTLASYFAHHIGRIYGKEQINYFEHKALHGGLGAISGWLLDSSTRGAVSGAIGGIVSEVVMDECRETTKNKAFDILAKAEQEGRSLEDGKFQIELYNALSSEIAFAKLSGASVAALLGQDASIAAHTSTNAVENNAIMQAVTIGLVAYDIYQVIKTYTEEGEIAALKKVAIDGGITLATLGTAKVVYQVGKLSAPMAEMVWQAYIAQNPGFAQVMTKVFPHLEKGFTKAKTLYQTADGALSEALAKGTQKLGKVDNFIPINDNFIPINNVKELEQHLIANNPKFNMINNPGPLSIKKGKTPAPAESFAGGKYDIIKLEEDLIIYRTGHSRGDPMGQWFDFISPSSKAQVRIDKAQKPYWIDSITGEYKPAPIDGFYTYKAPKGSILPVGPVANQGDIYVGGSGINQMQIFIPRGKIKLEYIDFTKFKD